MTVDGEVITDADLRLGYNHRGLEKLAEEKTYLQNIYLTERICGICSHSHATCFVQGVEKLLEIEPPRRGLYIRYLVSELERVHSHLLWLGVAGHEAGFDSFFMYTWRDREVVMDILEMISGNRVHYAINTLGGVRRDIDDALKGEDPRLAGPPPRKRTELLPDDRGQRAELRRPAGRRRLPVEGGRHRPLRRRADGPGLGHRPGRPQGRPLRRSTARCPSRSARPTSCDVLGRTVVRVKELLQSYNIIEFLLKNLPPGPVAVKAPRKAKPGEVVSRYEAPRGENMHYIKANGTDKPERLKVRAPTLANYAATVKMLKNGFIADIPLIFAAIDPCICCAERTVEVVDARSGEESVLRFSDLRRMAGERFKNVTRKGNAVWPF